MRKNTSELGQKSVSEAGGKNRSTYRKSGRFVLDLTSFALVPPKLLLTHL